MRPYRLGLYLGSEPTKGGTFQYNLTVLEAVSHLPREHYQVTLAYSSKDWEKVLQDYDLPRVHFPRGTVGRVLHRAFGLSGLPWAIWRYLSSLADPVTRGLIRLNQDLWIFPSQDALSYQAPAASLSTVHDLMHRYGRRFPEAGSWLEYRYRERHYVAISRYSRGVLVDSQCGKGQLIESYGIAPAKVHVLPFAPPPYLRDVNQSASFAEEVARKHSLPEKFFFYPAQFWQHKNHRILLEAIALLKDQLPEIQMVFVGSKKNGYAAILDLVRELGLKDQVHILGYVPSEELPLIFRKARAMLMPTYYGPTNIPPLEALALGCPAAVSRIYGMPEQVGDAGLLFDPANVNEVADIMERLWTDDSLCTTLSQKGLERSKLHDQSQMNRRLREILDQIRAQESYPKT